MKLDMHLHSNHSVDAISTPKTIMETAKKLGIVVAITDHNTVSAWPEFKKLSKEMEWPVIFGEEIKVIEKGKCVGEIVGLFMKKEIHPGPFGKIFDGLHAQNALAMVVHPFDVFRNDFKHLNEAVNKIDLFEVFNSRTTLGSHNQKAKEFAQKHNLAQTANSDSHSPKEIGMSYTEVKADNLKGARKELTEGNTKTVERKSPVTVHLTTQLAKMNLIKDQ